MTTCQSCLKTRRRFLGKLTAFAAAIGLAPLARAQASTSVPNPMPLNSSTAASLYAKATQDPDVTGYQSKLDEATRVDPPVQQLEQLWSNGVLVQFVVLPLTSYATGAPRAYLYYGVCTVDGSTLPYTLLYSDQGRILTTAGDVTDSQPNLLTYFDDTWFISFEQEPAGEATIIRTDYQVAQALPPSDPGYCAQKFHECLMGTAGVCIGAAAGAIVCIAIVSSCTSGAIVACLKVAGICAASAGALVTCAANMVACNNRAGECDDAYNKAHKKKGKSKSKNLQRLLTPTSYGVS